jgi:hypothetical protein
VRAQRGVSLAEDETTTTPGVTQAET